jgi:hypothetical protein
MVAFNNPQVFYPSVFEGEGAKIETRSIKFNAH